MEDFGASVGFLILAAIILLICGVVGEWVLDYEGSVYCAALCYTERGMRQSEFGVVERVRWCVDISSGAKFRQEVLGRGDED